MEGSPLRPQVVNWRCTPQFFNRPHVSKRTFGHCLNALLINTQVLADNVVSLHLHLAVQPERPDGLGSVLSSFQQELLGQVQAVKRQMGGTGLPRQTWKCYADLWRIPSLNNLPLALTLLVENTHQLSALYENLLPLAAKQPDQARWFYLLAHHLAALNEHVRIIGQAAETGPAK
jgi:hypothetical protein